jgi:V/A-type H+/Na+-transporting ATPase subunit I
MSIVPLVKVTLYGTVSEKESVLESLQTLGCVHLNDLRPATGEAGAPPATRTDIR